MEVIFGIKFILGKIIANRIWSKRSLINWVNFFKVKIMKKYKKNWYPICK